MLISRIAYEPVVLNGRGAFDSGANYSGAISVALIIPEAVRPYVRPFVRSSVRLSFFLFKTCCSVMYRNNDDDDNINEK